MRGVPWWGVVSSAAAPVLMVGGWTVAATLQPRFDPVADTVSALAAQGAADRWVMTLTFVVVGVCYVLTALALRPAGTAGRLILITGAVAGMLVAANPERAGDAYPWGHIVWASIGLVGVTAWPAGAWRRGSGVPWALRPAVAAAAVTVLLALVLWFGAELITGSGQAGLAERVAGAAQACWPLAVVLSCCRPVRASRRGKPAVEVVEHRFDGWPQLVGDLVLALARAGAASGLGDDDLEDAGERDSAKLRDLGRHCSRLGEGGGDGGGLAV